MRLNIRGVRPEQTIGSLEVDDSTSVTQLRTRVAERLAIHEPSRVRLLHMGHLLDDAHPLQHYHLQDGATVHCVIRPADAPTPEQQQQQQQQSASAASGAPPGATAMPFGVNLQDIVNSALNMTSSLVSGGGGGGQFVFSSHPNGVSGFGRVPIPPPTVFPAATTASAAPPQPPQPSAAASAAHAPPMTAATAQGIPLSSPPPQPVVAGVYLHVHCSLSELDEVPARLQHLGHQLHVPQVIIQATTAPREAASAHATSPATTATAAAAGQLPRATARAEAHAHPATISDVASAVLGAPLTSEPGSVEPRALRDVAGGALAQLGVRQAMDLMAGDWAVLTGIRGQLRERLATYITATAAGLSEEQLADREAAEWLQGIMGNPAVCTAMQQQQRPGVELTAELRRYLRRVNQEVLTHLRDTAQPDEAWTQQLRRILVHNVGLLLHRGGVWFTGGAATVQQVMQSAAQTLVAASVEQLPQLQPAVAMMPALLCSTLQGWQREYEAERQPADDEVFNGAARASAGAAGDHNNNDDAELDHLADELLGQREHATAASSSAPHVSAVSHSGPAADRPSASTSAHHTGASASSTNAHHSDPTPRQEEAHSNTHSHQ